MAPTQTTEQNEKLTKPFPWHDDFKQCTNDQKNVVYVQRAYKEAGL